MSRCPSDNTNFTNASNYYIVADDLSEILPWLSPLEPWIRRQDVRTHRIDNVGDWLLEINESRSWCDGGGGGESDSDETFSCHGDPGVGKTYIPSLVMDPLHYRDRGQNFAVVCFYFGLAPQKEQTPTGTLGSLLKQVVGGLEGIPEEIIEALRDQKKVTGGRELRLPEIAKMFQTISASRLTLICIGALDECIPEHQLKLLDSLREIVTKSPAVRIFATGGPHILDEIEKTLVGRAGVLFVKASKDDIIRYIYASRSMDTTPEAMDSSLELDIPKNVLETISEMFLLDSPKVETIPQESTAYRRRQKLSAMTNGPSLEDVCGVVLGRMKAQTSEKAKLGLATPMCVSHSRQPLEEDALCYGSTDLNTDYFPLTSTLLRCC